MSFSVGEDKQERMILCLLCSSNYVGGLSMKMPHCAKTKYYINIKFTWRAQEVTNSSNNEF